MRGRCAAIQENRRCIGDAAKQRSPAGAQQVKVALRQRFFHRVEAAARAVEVEGRPVRRGDRAARANYENREHIKPRYELLRGLMTSTLSLEDPRYEAPTNRCAVLRRQRYADNEN
jgi:hypothetical protein